MNHALTVDLEEWFHVRGMPPADYPRRARPATLRLLDLLGDVKATFFVLGCVARRDPALIREVVAAGHEIASHGFGHERVDTLTPEEFRADLRRSIDAIGLPPAGYRAPEWSRAPWMLRILEEEGFAYDSSVLSLRPRPYRKGRLWEMPVSPLLNGTAIRLRTAEALSRTIARVDAPAVVALHPCDLDPDFPWIGRPFFRGALRCVGRRAAAARIKRLLRDHAFGPIREALTLDVDLPQRFPRVGADEVELVAEQCP